VNRDLAGERLIVTAGADARKAIDPVRYISNARPGKMGYGSPPPRSGAERPSR